MHRCERWNDVNISNLCEEAQGGSFIRLYCQTYLVSKIYQHREKMKGIICVFMSVLLSAISMTFSFEVDFVNGTKAQGIVATSDCILGTQAKYGCDSSVAGGITDQILAELGNMGYSFEELDPQWIHCDGHCVNQLQTDAANSLASAAKSKNDYITLNSAIRSSAQQYLLYQWYLQHICGKDHVLIQFHA